MEWLWENKYLFWRNQNIGVFDPYSGKFRRKSKYELLGVSDILGCIDGKLVCIEVKSATGRLSDNQKKFIEMIENAGGIAGVARNIDDVKEIIARA